MNVTLLNPINLYTKIQYKNIFQGIIKYFIMNTINVGVGIF